MVRGRPRKIVPLGDRGCCLGKRILLSAVLVSVELADDDVVGERERGGSGVRILELLKGLCGCGDAIWRGSEVTVMATLDSREWLSLRMLGLAMLVVLILW